MYGSTSREILASAHREKPDLIVMGPHGRTGLPHMVLGSVAETTVRLSSIAVLTVPLSPAEKKQPARAVSKKSRLNRSGQRRLSATYTTTYGVAIKRRFAALEIPFFAITGSFFGSHLFAL
jgi:hypothetical protein